MSNDYSLKYDLKSIMSYLDGRPRSVGDIKSSMGYTEKQVLNAVAILEAQGVVDRASEECKYVTLSSRSVEEPTRRTEARIYGILVKKKNSKKESKYVKVSDIENLGKKYSSALSRMVKRGDAKELQKDLYFRLTPFGKKSLNSE